MMLMMLLCLAMDQRMLHFADINIQQKGKKLYFQGQFVPILGLDQEKTATTDFDMPIHELVRVITEVDQRRKELFPKGLEQSFSMFHIPLVISLRHENGEVIKRLYANQVLGIDKDDGYLFVENDQSYRRFPMSALASQKSYLLFLQHLLEPLRVLDTKVPKLSRYHVSLHYVRPKGTTAFKMLSVKRNIHTNLFGYRLPELLIGVGSAWCSWDGLSLNVHSSLDFHKRNAHLENLAVLENQGGSIEALEALLEDSPTSGKALSLLALAYERGQRFAELEVLLRNDESLFSMPVAEVKRLKRACQQWRETLFAKRQEFERSALAELQIISPQDGDVVGGDQRIYFSVNRSDLLGCELFVDAISKVTQMNGKQRIPIGMGDVRGKHELRLVSYFEDGTFQDKKFSVELLPINDQTYVNLRRMAMVVTRSGNLVTDLEMKDFQLKEYDLSLTPETFRKDVAPLQIAVLLDTSRSMTGDKLRQAKFAVLRFLENLEVNDEAVVYTFGNQVRRLGSSSDGLDSLLPKLYTVSPLGATALHDAISIAHGDLASRKGKKVIIVVSDGDDTASHATQKEIRALVANSSSLLYSLFLFRNESERLRHNFLKELTEVTGSAFYQLEQPWAMKRIFKNIYKELKAAYYLDYYSPVVKADPKAIEVTAGSRTNVRIRLLDTQ